MPSDEIEFRIPRTGNSTLAGKGWLLGRVNNDDLSRRKRDDRHHRWHNLAIYKTVGGKFVLHIQYKTNFIDRESDHDYANVFASVPEALFFAREVYNPLEFYIGIPAHHPNFAKGEQYKAAFVEQYRADCLDLAAQVTATIGQETTNVE